MNQCIRCGGQLDTGYNCPVCGWHRHYFLDTRDTKDIPDFPEIIYWKNELKKSNDANFQLMAEQLKMRDKIERLRGLLISCLMAFDEGRVIGLIDLHMDIKKELEK